MNTLLEVKNLSLTIDEKKKLLNDITFDIKHGEIFALVGESGSGKSLTSLAIMRLLSDAISVNSGDIQLKEKSLFALPEYQMQKIRGKSISMIFQEPMSALNPVMTVGEQVAEVLKIHLGLKKDAVKNRVISLFREVALKDPQERYGWYPHQLSGGQKQRVMIAMALACEPDLLIADEPTTALDVTIQAQVLKLLKQIRDKRNLSILFITHDMAVVSQMADRIAVMKNGEILEQGDCKEFFSNPQHPYSQKLLNDAMQRKEKRERSSHSDMILEVRNLKVYFPVKKGFFQRTVKYVKAVDDVSLKIAKGKTLALVGESGSGKSSIGKAILSLIDITEGSVWFEKQDLALLDQKALKPYRRKIQVVFQDPFSALNPRMTIGDIIREGMKSLNVGPQKRDQQDHYIKELLQKVELEEEHLLRYPHEFSGGQRQRIGIARALAVQPELIICDEPTSALDVSVRAQVLKLLKKLQDENDLSYLFITHDLSIIAQVADEVAVMKEGRIVEQGSVESVMHDPQHEYTKKLLKSAPKLPEMQKREAMIILFDLDGTLINSTEAILESFAVTFKTFEREIPSDEKIKSEIGHPLDVMFATLGVEASRVDAYVQVYKMHYRKISCAKTVLLPEAQKAVELASKYACLGIVTTKTAKYSIELLEHMKLMDYFDVLIGREDVLNPKPHPEPINKALAKLPSDTNNIWMIGDTCMDMLAAKSANIGSVGVICGYGTRDSLMTCTDNIYQNAYEAVRFIAKK